MNPDLELCREPAVLADVIEIDVIEEIPLDALLLLLILHPPKEQAAVVGSSSHRKARPGRGFHSRGAEAAPAPPVCNGDNNVSSTEESSACSVHSKALRIPALLCIAP